MTAYTGAQLAAIECLDRTLQIIACAGSGKTQVISQRIARLLEQPGVEPRNVIAFTFTDKAAAELKERVLGILQQERGDITGLAEMYIGTMHGYCLDLLQRLVPETFKYGVLTDITARLLVERNSKKSGLTTCPTSAPNTPTLRRYVNSNLFLQAMAVLREDTVDESQVPQGVLQSCASYLGLLGQHNVLDYTQMIALAVELLECDDLDDSEAPAVRQHIEQDIKYVVVDEYQDVNPLQERLIRGLTQFGANLCVVGDDDQTIYQWRGSEVRNILTFADRYDGVEQVTLADNFRSTNGIVSLGQSVAERLPTGQRLDKEMVAASHLEWNRGDLLALDFDSPQDEASWIADRIESLRGMPFVDDPDVAPRGLSWSDCAVLFRSVARDADPLVDELRRRGVPFVVRGLNRLFDSLEIQAVVQIFRYLVGETDADALESAWHDANLLHDGTDWASAMRVLDQGKDFARGSRWGIYNIQRLYLDFLSALDLREETISGGPERGELVFYQLGKFSEAISDFEQIYFNTSPQEKYLSFVKWLAFEAPDYYAESDSDSGFAQPDAVTISTVHQAKGMQWPAVFVPCVRRNRFPSQRHGGLNLFHVIPDTAVADADRYRGTAEDETRLFYVALTRAKKHLAVTFSPGPGRNHKRRSEFFDHCTAHSLVLTRDPGLPTVERLAPQPRHELPQVTLSFSELKYLFDCPYQFKLRFLYGFNPPLHEALGYGKGLHDALSEVHKRALAGEIMDAGSAEDLVKRHLHTPYAYPELRRQLEQAATGALERYFGMHGVDIANTVHSEKPIQVHIAPGITVDGRIDLIRRLDTDELSIVDFKSTDRAQAEEVTRDQLHVYAVGYEELSGERADLIEVLNLDQEGKNTREVVEDALLTQVRDRIRDAGDSIRDKTLARHPTWCSHCDTCDLVGLCRAGARA